jgi:pyruvate/2-oxoglutarate dehydrogenase complex dihydrolipoamide dehydrogenase (E3) component
VRLSAVADAETVSRRAPDVVVVATGGSGLQPALPGITRPRVIDLRDWLRRPEPLAGDAVLTVWGVDRAGVAAADAAATEGLQVLLLGAGSELAPEAGPREKSLMVRRLTDNPAVDVRTDTTLEAIDDHRLLIGHAGARQWIDVSGPVVVSQGTVPQHPDIGEGAWRTVVVGEAAQAGSAAEAIRQGAAFNP